MTDAPEAEAAAGSLAGGEHQTADSWSGTLAASRVSRAVADRQGPIDEPLRGTVHSVFARATNLRLRDGSFVSLCAVELQLPANGVAVLLPAERDFDTLGLTPGQPFVLDGEGLWFPVTYLRIDWQGVPRWEPRPRVAVGVTDTLLAERLARLRSLVLGEAPPGGLVPLLAHLGVAPEAPALDGLGQAALPAARQLVQSAGAGDARGAAEAAARLAGLGPGLTPAGDDLLAGFLACWALASGLLRLDPIEARRVVVAVLAVAVPRVSELGRAWLPHAARGEVSESQGALLSALLAREPGLGEPDHRLPAAARAVLAHGATSGGDWLAGVLLGGRAVLRLGDRAD